MANRRTRHSDKYCVVIVGPFINCLIIKSWKIRFGRVDMGGVCIEINIHVIVILISSEGKLLHRFDIIIALIS